MIPEILQTTPQRIAPDTHVIPFIANESPGRYISANTMVITGEQPVIVDTGVALAGELWKRDVFSVVAPEDVRWIFISHDDHDHIGNLLDTLEMCPNATLLTNAMLVGRLAGDFFLPLHRMRWFNLGETLDVGDRVLQAVRPPLFDSPTTTALFDTSTGVLWGADAFGCAVPGEVYDAADVPADLYDETFDQMNLGNTPWLEWVDVARFTDHLQQTARLPLTAVASAHGPVHRGEQIEDAFRRTIDLIGRPWPAQPTQATLDELVASVFIPDQQAPVPA